MTRGAVTGLLGAAPLGAVAALGLQPQGLWPLTLVALAGLFALHARDGSRGRGALRLWIFGLCYFLVALRWLMEPFQVEAEIYGWMAPFALVLLSMGLALIWGLAGMLGRGALGLALAWSLAELLRGYVLTGFPWGGFAQIWVDTPLAQALWAVGPYGLGALTLMLAAAPWMFRNLAMRIAAPLAVLASMALLSIRDWPLSPFEAEGAPTVRIVQPNAPQTEKWDPERWQTFFWRQVEATQAGDPPDLVIWPETAIPMLLDTAQEAISIAVEAARGAPLVVGIQRSEAARYYNSAVAIDRDGAISAIYDKHHLVPFGEYMPFAGLFAALGLEALADRSGSGYTAGPGPRVLEVAGIRALPLICYEAVFPDLARVRGVRPDLLLQLTNDAWFGTAAGPQQHLAQARMRAIEQGLPLLRSANTGISAAIGPYGQILEALELGVAGHFDIPLPDALPPTPYARTGDWPVTGVLLAGFVAVAMRDRRRNPVDVAGPRA